MSYQVLARKWRPSQFSEVVGQQHVLKPLEHALDKQRLHHAYLFTGTRGVGKTTIARILAKALNCEQGITAVPCGTCSACVEIDQGRFVDLLEIDAASRTKVEDTRELLDNVQYRPTRGRYKVYLIDEVHMLSRHSFNALLKTLEEPPEHVKFLLATTDPQKLPVTILSRCLQFNLKALSNDDITEQLSFVLRQEQVSADADALPLIARSAKGSMRDALSLTDQAIAQGDGSVELSSVRHMLGNVPVADVAALLTCVLNGDAEAVMQRVDGMVSMVPDLSSVLIELQSLLHQLALVQQVPAAANAFEDPEALTSILRRMPAELIQVFYRIVLEGRREQAFAVDARSGLEMTLLRLLSFRPGETVSSDEAMASLNTPETVEFAREPEPEWATESFTESELVAPSESSPAGELESDKAFASDPEPEPELSAQSPRENVNASDEPTQSSVSELLRVREQLTEKKNLKTTDSTDIEPPQPGKVTEPDVMPTEEHSTADVKVENEVPTDETTSTEYSFPELNDEVREAAEIDRWSAMIAGMDISGLARQVLLNSELQKRTDDHWIILVAEAQKSLLNDETGDAVTNALLDLLGASAQIEFSIGTPGKPTPLMVQQHINTYRHERACEIVKADQNVQELQQRFQAQLDESSIQAR